MSHRQCRSRGSTRGHRAGGWVAGEPEHHLVVTAEQVDASKTVRVPGVLREGRLPGGSGEDLLDLLVARGAEPVLYAGWEAIDAAEKAAGEPHGRPRVKLCSWDDLLAAARR